LLWLYFHCLEDLQRNILTTSSRLVEDPEDEQAPNRFSRITRRKTHHLHGINPCKKAVIHLAMVDRLSGDTLPLPCCASRHEFRGPVRLVEC
jgi:hypothetical protein